MSFFLSNALGRMQEAFEQEFTEHKAGKKLRWMNNIGTVSLDIELKDRTVSVDATPTEAAIIELFSEKGMKYYNRDLQLAMTFQTRHLELERAGL